VYLANSNPLNASLVTNLTNQDVDEPTIRTKGWKRFFVKQLDEAFHPCQTFALAVDPFGL
jgi:hypothetical protein